MSTKLDFEIVPLAEIQREESSISQPVVLVVDDETVIADTLSVILSRNGFKVLTAYDGESALELARMFPPNLLLTDVIMPGMTGVELATAVTEADPKCKVLLFSGQAATIDLLANAKKQGHHFNILLKPIHPSDLLRCISTCLAVGDEIEDQFEISERGSAKPDDALTLEDA
jgi:DNA-binding NtrC family response regulator